MIFLVLFAGCRIKPDDNSDKLVPNEKSTELSLSAKACSETIGKSILAEGEDKTLKRPESVKTEDLKIEAFRINATSMDNSYQFLSLGVSSSNELAAQYFKICVCDLANCERTKSCFNLKSHHLLPPLRQLDGKQVNLSLSACTDDINTYKPICGPEASQMIEWRPRLRAVDGLRKIDEQYETYFAAMKRIDEQAFIMWEDSCRIVNAAIPPKNALEEVYLNVAKNLCFSSSAFLSSVLAFDFINFVQLGTEEQPWSGKNKQIEQCHQEFQSLSLSSSSDGKDIPTSLRIGLPTLSIGLSVYVLGFYYGSQGWRGLASYAGFEVGGRLGSELGWRLGAHVLGWPGAFAGSITGGLGGAIAGGFVGGRVGLPLYRMQFRRTRDALIKEGALPESSRNLKAPEVDLSYMNLEQQKVMVRMNQNNESVGAPLKKYGGWSAFIGLIATSVGIIQLFSLTDTPSLATYMAKLAHFDQQILELVEAKNHALNKLVESFQ